MTDSDIQRKADDLWSQKFPGFELRDQDTQTQVNWRDNARRELMRHKRAIP